MGLLNDIGLKYDADKSSRFHHYLEFYQKQLPDRDFSGRLLEIGIMDGASMKMWREYYPNAEIVGIDIFDKQHLYSSDWGVPDSVKMLQVNGTVEPLVRELGMFDVIIDDGSHFMHDQQRSFELLYYSQLNKGGVYIIEDLWTSYIDYYQNAKQTTIDYLKKLEKGGMKMTHFKYKHTGPGIRAVFPDKPDLENLQSQTVAIKAGQK